jgi:hypothetical protein
MGKGRDPNQERQDHVSRPLSTLKDPSSFGPPPRNANYHGGAALPSKTTPDTSGWGAPLSQNEIQAAHDQELQEQEEIRAAEEEANKPPPPSGPYRVDTTGLSTSHLPKPPVMRVDVNEMRETGALPQRTQPKPKPSLPPRLPPRQNSFPTEFTPAAPPSYDTSVQAPSPTTPQLNQGALSRLGQAGISVPGFNIGQSNRTNQSSQPNPWSNEPSAGNTTASPPPSRLNELQSRFSRMATPSNPEPPTQGTTREQKQAAAKTASAFHKDPSSVSLSDARTAATTANNFRDRHGAQVSSGFKSASNHANNLNQKYGLAQRFNSFTSQHSANSPAEVAPPVVSPPPVTHPTQAPASSDMSVIAKKKPPPPPPGKKPNFNSPGNTQSPPPLPMGTKPRP